MKTRIELFRCFNIPFAEQVVPLEVRTLKFQADASAASNDLQEVQTTIALNYHISPSQANIIYQKLGADYADRIIAPTIQESVKASVAKFNAEELITKRAKAVIAKTIANTLGARDIVVETVFITDFKFSPAFATLSSEGNCKPDSCTSSSGSKIKYSKSQR